ncbi:MAG TPA: HNH endonuclease [Erysipelothrix sp.]
MNLLFLFDDLAKVDLIPGAIYEKGTAGNHFKDEPISEIFKLGNNMRGIGNQSGIRRSMVQSKDIANEIAFMVLINTGKDEDWKNYYDSETKILTYYGDNKTPNKHYLDTKQRGNKTLEEIFTASYGSSEDKYSLPPIFYFERHPKGVQYIGLAYPYVKGLTKDEVIQLQEFEVKEGNYENYVVKFTIIADERIHRAWLYDLKKGRKINSMYQPESWTLFLAGKLDVYDSEAFLSEEVSDVSDNEGFYGRHEKTVKTTARLTQFKFRERLLKERNGKCELCDVTNPKVLVASHIIPWSIATDNQKIDIDNGLLLCGNHDKLFDQGFITFDHDGEIMISNQVHIEEYAALNIYPKLKITLTEQQKVYMTYHRERIFLKE